MTIHDPEARDKDDVFYRQTLEDLEILPGDLKTPETEGCVVTVRVVFGPKTL